MVTKVHLTKYIGMVNVSSMHAITTWQWFLALLFFNFQISVDINSCGIFREALLDPFLSRYSIIIIDEAHERTIHTDVLLGLLKSVQMARSTSLNHYQNFANKKTKDNMLLEKENGAQCINFRKQDQRRKLPPLKLIIMSASMDAGVFSKYFEGAKAVRVEGRRFPVQILYICLDEPNYLDAAVTTILQVVYC